MLNDRFARAVAVALAAVAVLAGCGGPAEDPSAAGPGSSPSPESTPTAPAPATEATPDSTPSPQSSSGEPETLTVEEFGRDLLLHDLDGVRIARADGTVEPLWDEPVRVLRGDLRGGAVIQPRQGSRLPSGIYHLSGPGAEPELLVPDPEGDEAAVTLLNVVGTGSPHVLIDRQVARSESLQDTSETNRLVLVPLDGGEEQRLLGYNNWELSIGAAAYRGHPIWSYCYVECHPYRLIDGEEERIDVETGGEGGLVDLALASGGRELAILRNVYTDDGYRTELELFDLTGEHESVLVTLPDPGQYGRYVGLDTDGRWLVLVSRVVHRETEDGDYDEPLRPLVVDVESPNAEVRELDLPARAAFLMSAE